MVLTNKVCDINSQNRGWDYLGQKQKQVQLFTMHGQDFQTKVGWLSFFHMFLHISKQDLFQRYTSIRSRTLQAIPGYLLIKREVFYNNSLAALKTAYPLYIACLNCFGVKILQCKCKFGENLACNSQKSSALITTPYFSGKCYSSVGIAKLESVAICKL